MFRGASVALDGVLDNVEWDEGLVSADHLLPFPLADAMAPARTSYWLHSKIEGFMSVELGEGDAVVRMTQVHMGDGGFFMSSDEVATVAAKLLRPWEHCLCCTREPEKP